LARTRSVKPELLLTPRLRLEDLGIPAGVTLLYRLWDRWGRLLYVGISGNPIERWRTHAQKKRWWCAVDLITWEAHTKEHLALAAERTAIRSERPAHNRRSAVLA
jgi:predicted GIY-YIG superfamily endonuclease